MEYYIFWMRKDGSDREVDDEPFESYEEAAAQIEAMKAADAENGEEGVWVYQIDEREKDEDREWGRAERELECGDHPDSRSVVVAGGGVRRFGSSYQREMWEIGMRESDFF